MSDQTTPQLFEPQLVRINMAWALAALIHMSKTHSIEAPNVINLMTNARGVTVQYIYDVYQYVSPIFDQLVKCARLEESCRYSRAYQKKLEDAVLALRRTIDSLENEPNQTTIKRLLTVCKAR